MSNTVYQLLRGIADSEDDFEAEGDTVVFIHHGSEHSLTVSYVPELGPAIRRAETADEWISVSTYVQRDILRLPLLAQQIGRTLDKKRILRPIPFIDGPAEFHADASVVQQSSARATLETALQRPSYGSTQLIELMAPAGQGKTVLLEHLATQAARAYQPTKEPIPLLLLVDLLGRYVGTIHDAIAGALSNDYSFPGLTGRDVIACIRERWLNLALDGFDELVARVGTREAFLRTKELVDALGGAGTVVLSARDTFFDLFEIASSVRTYLQPLRGSYAIKELYLRPWNRDQARQVFVSLASPNPIEDLDGLLKVFGGDEGLVFRPFFTTRLAKAWIDGERFEQAGGPNGDLARQDYVIRVFLEREVGEKWRDRDGSAFLDAGGHIAMLGAVAEEMWRSGAFALTKDEVEISARVGLHDHGLSAAKIDDLVLRVPTHGFLALGNAKSVKFAHESFLEYMLGQRLGVVIARRNTDSARAMLDAAELSESSTKWALWRLRRESAGGQMGPALTWISDFGRHGSTDGFWSSNYARILGCAARIEPLRSAEFEGAQFVGECLREASFEDTTFRKCSFWMADLSGASFIKCVFDECQFGNLLLDPKTTFEGSQMRRTELGPLEEEDGSGLFAPADIQRRLGVLGLTIETKMPPVAAPVPSRRRVSEDAIRCIDKFRRAKTWHLPVEEMIERHGDIAQQIIEAGVDAGVFRETTRETSGLHKTFFCFAADRERLFAGQGGATGIKNIDAFWETLERLLPSVPAPIVPAPR